MNDKKRNVRKENKLLANLCGLSQQKLGMTCFDKV